MTNQPDSTQKKPLIEIPELLEEFEAWERASDEAWQMIDQMERRKDLSPGEWV